MNRIYRLVWNDLTRAWVAVAETARGRGKRSSATVGTLAASLALLGTPAHALDAGALPSGGRVVAGSVIRVDATRSGDGGTAILWSDLKSALYPAISAIRNGAGVFGAVVTLHPAAFASQHATDAQPVTETGARNE